MPPPASPVSPPPNSPHPVLAAPAPAPATDALARLDATAASARALLGQLDDLRDTLSGRLAQLSNAIVRLRAQATRLEQSRNRATSLTAPEATLGIVPPMSEPSDRSAPISDEQLALLLDRAASLPLPPRLDPPGTPRPQSSALLGTDSPPPRDLPSPAREARRSAESSHVPYFRPQLSTHPSASDTTQRPMILRAGGGVAREAPTFGPLLRERDAVMERIAQLRSQVRRIRDSTTFDTYHNSELGRDTGTIDFSVDADRDRTATLSGSRVRDFTHSLRTTHARRPLGAQLLDDRAPTADRIVDPSVVAARFATQAEAKRRAARRAGPLRVPTNLGPKPVPKVVQTEGAALKPSQVVSEPSADVAAASRTAFAPSPATLVTIQARLRNAAPGQRPAEPLDEPADHAIPELDDVARRAQYLLDNLYRIRSDLPAQSTRQSLQGASDDPAASARGLLVTASETDEVGEGRGWAEYAAEALGWRAGNAVSVRAPVRNPLPRESPNWNVFLDTEGTLDWRGIEAVAREGVPPFAPQRPALDPSLTVGQPRQSSVQTEALGSQRQPTPHRPAGTQVLRGFAAPYATTDAARESRARRETTMPDRPSMLLAGFGDADASGASGDRFDNDDDDDGDDDDAASLASTEMASVDVDDPVERDTLQTLRQLLDDELDGLDSEHGVMFVLDNEPGALPRLPSVTQPAARAPTTRSVNDEIERLRAGRRAVEQATRQRLDDARRIVAPPQDAAGAATTRGVRATRRAAAARVEAEHTAAATAAAAAAAGEAEVKAEETQASAPLRLGQRPYRSLLDL